MAIRMPAGATLSRRRFLSSAGAAAAATVDRRCRKTLSQLRGGSSAHHPRPAVGRRVDRFRHGVGARRPARAHAGRGRDHRELPAHPPRRLCRRAAGERLHRQAAARGPAAGAGHLLSRPLPEPVVAGDRRRAAGRALPHRAGATARPCRSSGRATPPAAAGASISRAAACAPTRPCWRTAPTSSSIAATSSMPTARSARSTSCRTARCGGTSSPRRNPRSPRRSPSSAATTNTICSTRTCARSTPRCRSSRSGTITRSPTTGSPAARAHGDGYREKSLLNLVARGCRAFHEFMPLRQTQAEAGRIYRKISYGPLLDVFMLDMRSYRGCQRRRASTSYGPDAHLLGPTQLAWLKRELHALARDLEGDRRRPADRHVQP